jgi:hypothetical protein
MGRKGRGRMTEGELLAALVGALLLAAVGLPGVGGLVAVIAALAFVLRADRRSGRDRRRGPAGRRGR